MTLGREGLREMLASTVVLGGGAGLALWLGWWPAAVPLAIVWLWVMSFFRDPHRVTRCRPGELCAPADGRVTEISRLDHHDRIGGPALRVGIFLSLFSVHINRSPCEGTVRSVSYSPGRFLDARHRDSGKLNESNMLVIDPPESGPVRGPIVVRQVAGLLARRIVCHAQPGDHLAGGARFGMIKFGSRTELIIPDDGFVEVAVRIGSKVRAGVTILARQTPLENKGDPHAGHCQVPAIGSKTSA